MPVKNKNVMVIEKEAEKLQRWKEHFESVLNRPDPPHLADIQPADTDLDICTDPPSLEEVTAAIKAMKSGKAPGADGVTAEMLKADVNVTAPILTEIFKQIWEGQIPEAWKTGLIFKLPKKGDLGDCNNWRGITLLSLTSKVFSRIVLSRLTAVLEKDLRPQQAGSALGDPARITSSLCARFWNRAKSGTHRCTSISLTWKRRLTASTESPYGRS